MTEQPKKKRGPGRPATGRKRNKTMNMKFTEKERAYLKDQAKQLNLSLSDYVLKLAKYYEDNHQSTYNVGYFLYLIINTIKMPISDHN